MNPYEIQTAEGRLKLCKRAFDALLSSYENLQSDIGEAADFETHWLDFLVQWKGVYSKIQQAAKDSPAEIQWFGAVNQERRRDPLLRWLFEARNDAEHGLGRTTSRIGHNIYLGPASGESGVFDVRFGDGGIEVVRSDGSVVENAYTVEAMPVHLVAVSERDGIRKVEPPTEHFGKSIDRSPIVAAELGFNWLASLVKTAEAMMMLQADELSTPATNR
ncbi:hypothetical protein [Novosphingobium sp.]|uniref:hypothetical protein n=1 Tax=Novosphingobium sp. TaxID=1874826 RepID=UPI0025DA9823|nr:hypothetical protein [Novosphingobium sp.]MCC6927331.1 hypothetical protein [Novosphingobium sp.]